MTLSELGSLLETTGYPVAYRSFSTTKTPPFICYLVAYSNNFSADGKVFAKAEHIQVELYTDKKDQIAEARVENALSGFFWQKTEIYLQSEAIYQIIYEIEV